MIETVNNFKIRQCSKERRHKKVTLGQSSILIEQSRTVQGAGKQTHIETVMKAFDQWTYLQKLSSNRYG